MDLNDPNAGAGSTYALAISDTGEIVGYYLDADGNEHPFLYTGGTNGTYYDLTSLTVKLLPSTAMIKSLAGTSQVTNEVGFLTNSVEDATVLLGSGTIVSDSTLTIGGTDILDVETASNSPVTFDDVTVSNGNRIEIGTVAAQSYLLMTNGSVVTDGELVINAGAEPNAGPKLEILNGKQRRCHFRWR